MKKVLVCALAALMLMTTCMSALANPLEASNYVTTTTYVIDAEGNTKLQVNTHADAAAGTMLTYLAHTTATPTDDTIVYIDQQTADDEGADFVYTTAKENITGVTVKYGSSLNNNAVTEADTYNLRAVTVTYDSAIAENRKSETIYLPTTYGVPEVVVTNITVPTPSTCEATINGEAAPEGVVTINAAGKLVITDNAALTGDSIAINVKVYLDMSEIEPGLPVINEEAIAHGRFTGYEDGEVVEKMTMFGYADTALEAGFGGIIVGNTIEAVESATFDAPGDATVYPALFKNSEGAFAVQLVNKTGNGELTGEDVTWFGKIYVKNEGGYSYSAVKTISEKSQAEY